MPFLSPNHSVKALKGTLDGKAKLLINHSLETNQSSLSLSGSPEDYSVSMTRDMYTVHLAGGQESE